MKESGQTSQSIMMRLGRLPPTSHRYSCPGDRRDESNPFFRIQEPLEAELQQRVLTQSVTIEAGQLGQHGLVYPFRRSRQAGWAWLPSPKVPSPIRCSWTSKAPNKWRPLRMPCWESVLRRTDRSASSSKSIRSFYHSPPLILIVHNPRIPAALPSLFIDSPPITFDSCSREKAEKKLQLNNIRLWSVTFGSRRETNSRCSN